MKLKNMPVPFFCPLSPFSVPFFMDRKMQIKYQLMRTSNFKLHQFSIKLVFIICVVFELVACGVSKSDIAGKYEADYDVAKEVLILKTDGHFKQEVTLKATGKTDISQGTWSYGDDGIVTFNENLMILTDEYGNFNSDYNHPAKGIVGLPIQWYLGEIYLTKDQKVNYRKL